MWNLPLLVLLAACGKDPGDTADTAPEAPVRLGSFVIVTDPHVGMDGDDFGSPGWDDGDPVADEAGLDLQDAVARVNAAIDTFDIRFVAMLGDLADSGEVSEMTFGRDALRDLQVPWVPALGNHDLWPWACPTPDPCEQAPTPLGDAQLQAVMADDLAALPAVLDDDLTCTVTSPATDPDGDALTYAFAFLVDGVEVQRGAEAVLSADRSRRGQQVRCLGIASDGIHEGPAGESDPVTIANTPPTVDEVTLTPAEPVAGDLLTCAWSGFTDADGDGDASTAAWTVNGVPQGTGSVLTSGFVRGDLVTCTVTPHDGTETGDPASASVSVLDAPPALDAVWLTPTDADVLDDLTCTPGAAVDPDPGDTVSFSYAWLLDGAPLGVTDATLASRFLAAGATVQCVVTPTDGVLAGDPVSSNTVTIAVGPVLSLGAAALDFGDVVLGCDGEAALPVSNTGTDTLRIATATLLGDAVFSADFATPVVLEPGETRDLRLRASPSEPGTWSGVLVLETDDPTTPTARIPLSATSDWVRQTDTFTAATVDADADVVLALDTSASMDDDRAALEDALPSLLDTLTARGLDWQVGIVIADDGCVIGDTAWVDPSLSDADLADALDAMLVGGGGTYMEAAFALFELALDGSLSGGCNDGLVRDGASLELVGVSDEEEQSGGDWEDWVADLQAWKDDPADVRIHGIGGDFPSGCGSSTAYRGIYEASVATGGCFVSICTTDWDTTLADLAACFPEGLPSYPLSSTPVDPDAIEVRVDGVPVTDGWTWDEDDNAVVFSSDAPPTGAVVEVLYEGPATTCP